MATAITFLKNYQKFGRKIRPVTASLLYDAMINSNNKQDAKIYFLRIFEENLSSSEDLLYWSCAAFMRDEYPLYIDNEWEFLLNVGIHKGIEDAALISNLEKITKLQNGKKLLESFGIKSIEEFCIFGKIQKSDLVKMANRLLTTLKACYHNRSASETVLLRSQNKIKHGMVVIDEGEKLFIRDYYAKKGINRNLELTINPIKAKAILGTINANSVCMSVIISIFLYRYSILFRQMVKRGLTEQEKQFWKESADYSYE